MGKVTVDLVTERPDGALVLVLVEEGPWRDEHVEPELRRVQGRLFDCVEAAVDGVIARLYPQSKGRGVVIRLDCYDVPREPIETLFTAFQKHMSAWEELQRDIERTKMVSRVECELHCRTTPNRPVQRT